jgi:hypothetical protein
MHDAVTKNVLSLILYLLYITQGREQNSQHIKIPKV